MLNLLRKETSIKLARTYCFLAEVTRLNVYLKQARTCLEHVYDEEVRQSYEEETLEYYTEEAA